MKRLALISEHASPLAAIGGTDSGGQNIYVAQVARHLARRGMEVDIFTRRDDPRWPTVADWVEGVRVIHVPAGPPRFVRKEDLWPYMDGFASWIKRFAQLQAAPYDLVHANFWMSGYAALRLKREAGLPFLMTFHALGRVRRMHQQEADQFPAVRLDVEDEIAREADALVAECPQDEDDLRVLYGAAPERLTLIPCGFDPAEFYPIGQALARSLIGMPSDERLLLQLGRLVPRKGIDNVIRALGLLRNRLGLTARLMVVGGDRETPDPSTNPEMDRLIRVAKEAGVAEHVDFLGMRPRERLKYFYAAADAFITTPWYEPFGMTPLESMACGTPVIASDVGGLRYSVVHGATGYLVPPKDPWALACQIAQFYEQPETAARLGRQALARVRRQFTWDSVAQSLWRCYADTLAGVRSASSLHETSLRPAIACP